MSIEVDQQKLGSKEALLFKSLITSAVSATTSGEIKWRSGYIANHPLTNVVKEALQKDNSAFSFRAEIKNGTSWLETRILSIGVFSDKILLCSMQMDNSNPGYLVIDSSSPIKEEASKLVSTVLKVQEAKNPSNTDRKRN